MQFYWRDTYKILYDFDTRFCCRKPFNFSYSAHSQSLARVLLVPSLCHRPILSFYDLSTFYMIKQIIIRKAQISMKFYEWFKVVKMSENGKIDSRNRKKWFMKDLQFLIASLIRALAHFVPLLLYAAPKNLKIHRKNAWSGIQPRIDVFISSLFKVIFHLLERCWQRVFEF